MELINDNNRLLRLAVVFQLDLEDLVLSLKFNSSPAANKIARSDFLNGVSLFLEHAMVSTAPAIESSAIKPTTGVVPVPAAVEGSVPSVDALSYSMAAYSMATTRLPGYDDDTLSDTDIDEPSDTSNAVSTHTHPSAVLTKNPATNQAGDDDVSVSAAGVPAPGSYAFGAGHKRGREDDEEGEERESDDGSDKEEEAEEEEDGKDGENEDNNPKSANGEKFCCGGRKHRKMVHSHSCSVSCGESMRIDE